MAELALLLPILLTLISVIVITIFNRRPSFVLLLAIPIVCVTITSVFVKALNGGQELGPFFIVTQVTSFIAAFLVSLGVGYRSRLG